jgi:hypothetical protein
VAARRAVPRSLLVSAQICAILPARYPTLPAVEALAEAARVLATVQMIGDLVRIGLVIRAFLLAEDRGRHRRQQETDADARWEVTPRGMLRPRAAGSSPGRTPRR